METTLDVELDRIAQDLKLRTGQVSKVVQLLDDRNTVPFITRYRKDQTGGLDEEQIRRIQAEVTGQRLLLERKQTILRSIQSQGKLTDELIEKIYAAPTVRVLEDLYLPFKPKKQTLATAARNRGLEPLANEILSADPLAADLDARAKDFVDEDKQVPSPADALLGAGHILAESFSERPELRGKLRKVVRQSGKFATAKGDKAEEHKELRDYFDYQESVGRIKPHRVLAINRGERSKAIKVKLECDFDKLQKLAEEQLVPPGHPHADFLAGCARDALNRLILPSLERELRRELTEKAEEHAVSVFARNLKNLLLQPPVKGRRLLAIDPGFKSGCKLAALDEFGNLIDHGVVYLIGSDERKAEARQKTAEVIRQHQLGLVAIGNGTACRETEEMIAEVIAAEFADSELAYVIVNEAGASVYSTSQMGREEFPDFDATLRGTISIGRRLQDPLSELVKINPQSLGVGLYQHDIKQKHLKDSLDGVVESAVNYVGVDLNTASVALLGYVSGLNQLIARRIVEYRQEHGPFKNRQQLQDVNGIGDAIFTQAAGFLKISDGDNPLDRTWIHPETYQAASQLLERCGYSAEVLRDPEKTAELAERLRSIEPAELAEELSLGELTLQDILADLARPGRDPREDLPPPIFKQGILKLEDLKEGMELTGTVLNVVDFGAFIDIGLKDSGLVHVSELSDKFIDDPHSLVALGDIVRVWVLGVDKERRRVSLTMVDAETRAKRSAEKPQKKEKRPRRQSRGKQGKEASRKGSQRRSKGPPRKPKPRKKGPPLTKEMKEGKEPLRSFGDLLQFYEDKDEGGDRQPD